MTLLEAISERHSVRSFDGRPLEPETVARLNEEIALCNAEGNLHIQLVTNEPKAFSTGRSHYGRFSGVTDYVALVGRGGDDLDERLGYYGERVVLLAQTLGLCSCWVGLTFAKVPDAFELGEGEKLRAVIAIGHATESGVPHKSKDASQVCNLGGNEPDWFMAGLDAALLAPTAVNQQKFKLEYVSGSAVKAKAGLAFFARMDLGIVKYHFEIGAGRPVEWIRG